MSERSRRDELFTEFVAARRTHLRRIAYAICGDWHQADDLLQAALLKLYVAWPRVRRDGREEAYVRQILVRVNIDEHRRPWRRREQPGLDGHDRAAGVPDVTERSSLFEAIQQLPISQRKVVVLRHWLGLSVAETAAELDVAEGTVKAHSARALERLNHALTREFC
ncbi:MAG: SigE family RNA polymerase sigma factor [Nocardioides sp.]